MSKKKIFAFIMIMVLVCSMLGSHTTVTKAANAGRTYSISKLIGKIKESISARKNGKNNTETKEPETKEPESSAEVVTEEQTTTQNETSAPSLETEKETDGETVIEAETKTETETEPETETETEPETETETETESETETETEPETETETEIEPETETETEPETEIQTETETATGTENNIETETEFEYNEMLTQEKMDYYEKLSQGEAQWLWNQQLSNGAFAFYYAPNGSILINPYFSEITAIALINYDKSEEAKHKIEKYFDWHLSHINTEEEDYNGLAGTIYDYDAVNQNGIVISETSKGSYDSTDSYSALFVKALADYVKAYGDGSYLNKHEDTIKDIVNVMFATMSGGYTYAKPDYKIRYLMDNSEVYAGLKAAEYIYSNVIVDDEMYKKVSAAVDYYDKNFNNDWWKGDHYASILNTDNSEYTGIEFSWDNFYPCATSQMFPIIYGIVEADSTYAKTVYEGLCSNWNWQEMDYVANGTTVFCWGNFAYLAALMNDEDRLASYMNKYEEIINKGRPYPLYSSESAMVLMGCNKIIYPNM